MDPPPPAPPISAVADSIESSPRSRTTDSFIDDSLPPVHGAQKLRLMCSYGGHIVPRPHNKSLCYVGGDTRMVVVDRNVSLTGLIAKVAKTLFLHTKPFSLKYQLPNEDLDSLISLAGDEDLESMIEEYDRICAAAVGVGGKGSRLRLFVFPVQSESIGSIGSLLDCSVKSDEWFLSALNGSGALSGGFSDSASVNCLLGLENDVISVNNNELGVSRGLDSEFGNGGKNVKISNQDVHSMPGSPMMETTSSFGSANSVPIMANLPPIKVREDGGGVRVQDQRLGTEEKLVQMSVSAAADNFTAMSSTPPPIPTTIVASIPVQSTVMTSLNPVVRDSQNTLVSDDERSDHGGMLGEGRKSPQPQSQVLPQQTQPQPANVGDTLKPDSFPSDDNIPSAIPRSNQMSYPGVIQASAGDNRISANLVDQRNLVIESNNAPVQLQNPLLGSGYMVQPQIEQQNYPYPQQFVHAGIQYVIQQPVNPLVMPPYYPGYPPQQHVQHPHHQPIQLRPQQYQHSVYIVQAPPPSQSYNMSAQHRNYPESSSVVFTGHLQTPVSSNKVPDSAKSFSNNQNISKAPNPEVSSAIYRATSAVVQPKVQVAPNIPQQQFFSYAQVNQQPQVTSAPNPTYNYEIPDPSLAQIYYTQPLAPSVISQYQTLSSAQVMEVAATQPQNDNIKPSQIKSS